MIRVIPFRPGHFDFMGQPKEIFMDDPGITKRIEEAAAYSNTVAYSFLIDKTVIAVFCGTIVFDTILDVYGVTTEAVKRFPTKFYKTANSLLLAIERKYKIHRSQMIVNHGYRDGKRFAYSLGFREEGIMKKYGADKKDYSLWAKVKE